MAKGRRVEPIKRHGGTGFTRMYGSHSESGNDLVLSIV
jgi:hypothetical protein